MIEYRTRLIADAVTGKLDVREATAAFPDEPESSEPEVEEQLDDEATGMTRRENGGNQRLRPVGGRRITKGVTGVLAPPLHVGHNRGTGAPSMRPFEGEGSSGSEDHRNRCRIPDGALARIETLFNSVPGTPRGTNSNPG